MMYKEERFDQNKVLFSFQRGQTANSQTVNVGSSILSMQRK